MQFQSALQNTVSMRCHSHGNAWIQLCQCRRVCNIENNLSWANKFLFRLGVGRNAPSEQQQQQHDYKLQTNISLINLQYQWLAQSECATHLPHTKNYNEFKWEPMESFVRVEFDECGNRWLDCCRLRFFPTSYFTYNILYNIVIANDKYLFIKRKAIRKHDSLLPFCFVIVFIWMQETINSFLPRLKFFSFAKTSTFILYTYFHMPMHFGRPTGRESSTQIYTAQNRLKRNTGCVQARRLYKTHTHTQRETPRLLQMHHI